MTFDDLKLSDSEQEFVKTESDFINGSLYHKRDVARAMARDHRYLVGQRGELAIEYLKVLAVYERKGFYDPRNEWACKAARVAIDALVKAGVLYVPYEEREELGLAKTA